MMNSKHIETLTPGQKAAAKRRANAESALRIALAQAEARRAAETNRCPLCGSAVRRNLAITGWVQCEQFGDGHFRARPSDPSCNWQGFTR